MTKGELENLLCKAGELARDRDFYLIGSQALHGVCSIIPKDFPKTIEADLYPRHTPQAWTILRQQLGPNSSFCQQHGYYLDCVDPCLSTLPDGWTERLIPFQTPRTGGVTAWCLEPHDLFVSKLVAWREKDKVFLRSMFRHKLVRAVGVLERIEALPISPARKDELSQRVKRFVAGSHARRSPARGKN